MNEQNEKQAIKEMAKILCEDCAKDTTPCVLTDTGKMCESVFEQAEALYKAGYRKQSEIVDDIIAIIEQRMARNIERLNGCQSDIWKVGYLAENKAYQDIKEIIEQRMKGGAE